MSSKPIPLLNAHPEADEAVRLRREIAGLERELQEAKDEAIKAKGAAADAIQAIRALRDSPLDPLFKALKMIFGEISRVDVEAVGKETSRQTASSALSPRWEMLKQKLGGRQAEFIDLLQHGEMTTAQLAAAAHCHHQTVANTISRLKGAGLVQKNGSKFSLKDL